MMRWVTFDHAYENAFAELPHANHEEWFDKALFGTSNFLDIALRDKGQESTTLVQNFFSHDIAMIEHAKAIEPDVVLSREAGRWSGTFLRQHFPKAKLVCTCSHRVEDSQLANFDVVFSSFSWFPKYCRRIGVRCEWLPLAFGRRIAETIEEPSERDIPVAFFGGLGARIWRDGTAAMAAVAESQPGFQWYGYKCDLLPNSLVTTWSGHAWGRQYLSLMKRTKLCLNRTGEIAKGEGNNMRTFEIPGCGAWMITDNAGEMRGFCDEYESPAELISIVQKRLSSDPFPEGRAARAQKEVLDRHCYENRVPKMLEIIESL